MEEQKPKSVRTIGLIVSIFSGFIIFSNALGALASSLVGFGDDQNRQEEFAEFNLMEFMFDHYLLMCFIMVIIGVLYLIGGIYIRKYKRWANHLVTFISALLFVFIWALMITMSSMTAGDPDMEFFSIGAILNAVFWSTPVGLLIWFLNRKKIKKHFS